MYTVRRVYRPLRTDAEDSGALLASSGSVENDSTEISPDTETTSNEISTTNGEGLIGNEKKNGFLCLKKFRNRPIGNAQLVDGLSAILSFIALCIAIWRMRARPKAEYLMEMTEANLLMAPRSSHMLEAITPLLVMGKTKALGNVCTAGGAAHEFLPAFAKNMFLGFWLPLLSETPYEIAISNVIYDEEAFIGSTFTMRAGQYDPMSALVWIFIVSVAFQGARVWLFVLQGNRHRNNKSFLFSEYRPYAGPDFWRWIEYALTSPFQIIIIASSFRVTDRSLLLTLGALQGALTILGFCIELQIQKLAKHRVKLSRDPTKARKRSHMIKAIILIWSAWALHGVIWFVLFERFERQKDNLKECGYLSTMPWAVNLIVFGEFFLFTLFGLVPSTQLLLVITKVNNNNEDKESPPDVARWELAAMAYAILSVTAKSLLEYGFLALLETMPPLTNT